MAALWSLAAYGASAAYGDDSGVVWGGYSGSYNYGNFGCTYYDDGEMTDIRCDEVADDGECDHSCNSAACSWDGMDCFHDDK